MAICRGHLVRCFGFYLFRGFRQYCLYSEFILNIMVHIHNRVCNKANIQMFTVQFINDKSIMNRLIFVFHLICWLTWSERVTSTALTRIIRITTIYAAFMVNLSSIPWFISITGFATKQASKCLLFSL